MAFIKKYGILFGKFFGFFLVGSFVLSILNYFCLSSSITHKIGFFYLILLLFIFSFKEAKKKTERGIITGIKTGSMFLFLLFLTNIIFYHSPFKWVRIIYYMILLFASILGGIMGINTKKSES